MVNQGMMKFERMMRIERESLLSLHFYLFCGFLLYIIQVLNGQIESISLYGNVLQIELFN